MAKSSAPSSSESAPPRPDLWSTDVPQAPPVNWKYLMNIDYDQPPAPARPPPSEVLDFTGKHFPKIKLPMTSKPTDEPGEKY